MIAASKVVHFRGWSPQTPGSNMDVKKNYMHPTSTLMYVAKHNIMEALYHISLFGDNYNMALDFMQMNNAYSYVWKQYDHLSKGLSFMEPHQRHITKALF